MSTLSGAENKESSSVIQRREVGRGGARLVLIIFWFAVIWKDISITRLEDWIIVLFSEIIFSWRFFFFLPFSRFIFINLPLTCHGLLLLVATWICWRRCRNDCASLLVPGLLVLLNCCIIGEIWEVLICFMAIDFADNRLKAFSCSKLTIQTLK